MPTISTNQKHLFSPAVFEISIFQGKMLNLEMVKQSHSPLRPFSFLHTQDTMFATLANSLANFL